MNTDSGFRLFRTNEHFYYLIKKRPSAWVLLCLIAARAKRTLNHPDVSLEMGEALIGDFRSYGATRQSYRSDINLLTTHHFLTIRSTNKGTIAKIVDTRLIDLQAEMLTNEVTKDQPSTNHQPTTNHNDIRRKEEKKKSFSDLEVTAPTALTAKNSLVPLTRGERYELAITHRVPLEVVVRCEQDALNPENVEKYRHKTTFHTVAKWLNRGISNKQIATLGDQELSILKLLRPEEEK